MSNRVPFNKKTPSKKLRAQRGLVRAVFRRTDILASYIDALQDPAEFTRLYGASELRRLLKQWPGVVAKIQDVADQLPEVLVIPTKAIVRASKKKA